MKFSKSSYLLALVFCVLCIPLKAQKLYFTDGDAIKSINYDGTDEQTFLTNGETPLRLAVDPTASKLFYSTYGGEHVWSVDVFTGNNDNLVYDYGAMAGLDALDAFYADGFIVTADAVEIDGVSSIPYDGSTIESWPLNGPPDIGNYLFSGLAVWQANEEVFLSYGNKIYKAGVYDRNAVTIAHASTAPTELDFDQTREYLYYIDGTSQDEIWKMDASSGVSNKIYTATGTITRLSVNDLNGNIFFLEGSAIKMIDNTGGSLTTIKSGITNPNDIIFIEDPDPYTVKNTNDSGPNSLRYCLQNANLSSGQTIKFDIYGSGPFTIQPLSPLPAITSSMTINGYSQSGSATNNSSVDATNTAALKIVLNGMNAGAGVSGLTINHNNVIVKGLAINNFSGDGISIGAVNNITIEGNFIGTDATGTSAVPNNNGISMDGASFVTIGGTYPSAHNIISGNSQNGIVIDNGTTNDQNKILGNFIGGDKTGATNLGNGQYGIEIHNSGANQIGNNTVTGKNVIAFNQYGVVVDGTNATTNLISQNANFCNANENISLLNGGNNAKSAPVVGYAASDSISGTAQNGDLIEIFYDSSDCKPSGGQVLFASVTANSSGFWYYNPSNLKVDYFVTATATDGSNNTSAFSNDKVIPPEITNATLDPANRFVDVTFNTNIYNAADPGISITPGNFKLVFQANGGSATGVTIFSVKKTDSDDEASASDPTGGEKTLRLFLDVSGTQTGTETIEIFPKDGNRLASPNGNAVAATSSTGVLTLNPPPAATNGQTDYVLCSGEKLNIGLVGNLLGTVFSWTSDVTSVLLTGNTSSGSGDINDVLINTGTEIDTVTYHVLPSLFGVLGISYDIDAAVLPEIKATLSLEDDSNAATVCSNDTLNLKITVQGIGPWEAQWTNGTTTKTETFSNNQHIFKDVPPGSSATYKLNYIKSTYAVKQCDGTVSGTVNVTIRSIDGDPVISGPASVCQSESGVSYSIADPVPADAYLWNIPTTLTQSGGSMRTATPDIAININDDAVDNDITVRGLYTCYASERYNKQKGDTISVAVYPKIKATLALDDGSASASICAGDTLSFKIDVQGVGPWEAQWTNGPTTKTETFSGSKFLFADVPTGNAVTYKLNYVTSTNPLVPCDGELSGAVDVTIRSIDGDPVISGPASVCQSESGVSYSIADPVPADAYLWNIPTTLTQSGGSIRTTTPDIAININDDAIDNDITVRGLYTCYAHERYNKQKGDTISIAVYPKIKATLALDDGSAAASICAGDTLSFKIDVQGVGPWEAQWTNGTTTKTETFSGSEFIFTDVPSGNKTTYALNYVTSTNPLVPCDGEISGTVDVTIRSIDGDPVISGSASVCQGTAGAIYTLEDKIPADAYSWDIPNSISKDGGKVQTSDSKVNFDISDDAQSSSITVMGIYKCYSGERMGRQSAPFAISVTPSESDPGSISGPDTVCLGTAGVAYIINNPVAADGYEWTIPSGLSTTSGAVRTKYPEIRFDISSSASTGDLTVRGIFTCGGTEVLGPPSAPLTVNVIPALTKPEAISGPDAICEGTNNVIFTLTPEVAGAEKYIWSLPSGVTESSTATGSEAETTTNSISLNFDAANFAGGNITVAVSNQCGVRSENADPLSLTAKRLPDTPGKIRGDSLLCAESADVEYKIDAVRGATTYLWDLPAFLSPSSGSDETKNNQIATKIGSESSKGSITVSAKNECGISDASPAYNVQISTLPALNFSLPDQEIYIGQVIQVSGQADQEITSYEWDFGDGKQMEGQDASHVYQKGGDFTVTLTGTNTFNCTGSYSDDLNVQDQLPITIQNVITQNDDQVNDGLYIQGIDKFPNNEVTLLNRLGSKVFQTQHYANDWNTSFGSKKLEPGNYLCVVKIDGIHQTFKQTISVLDNQ